MGKQKGLLSTILYPLTIALFFLYIAGTSKEEPGTSKEEIGTRRDYKTYCYSSNPNLTIEKTKNRHFTKYIIEKPGHPSVGFSTTMIENANITSFYITPSPYNLQAAQLVANDFDKDGKIDTWRVFTGKKEESLRQLAIRPGELSRIEKELSREEDWKGTKF